MKCNFLCANMVALLRNLRADETMSCRVHKLFQRQIIHYSSQLLVVVFSL